MCVLIVYVVAWHCCVVVLQLNLLAQLLLIPTELGWDGLALWGEGGGRVCVC